MTVERNRHKPMIGGSVEPRHKATMERWVEQSGLSFSRILREVIQFAANNGYRPGSVSIAALRDDAKANLVGAQTRTGHDHP